MTLEPPSALPRGHATWREPVAASGSSANCHETLGS